MFRVGACAVHPLRISLGVRMSFLILIVASLAAFAFFLSGLYFLRELKPRRLRGWELGAFFFGSISFAVFCYSIFQLDKTIGDQREKIILWMGYDELRRLVTDASKDFCYLGYSYPATGPQVDPTKGLEKNQEGCEVVKNWSGFSTQSRRYDYPPILDPINTQDKTETIFARMLAFSHGHMGAA